MVGMVPDRCSYLSQLFVWRSSTGEATGVFKNRKKDPSLRSSCAGIISSSNAVALIPDAGTMPIEKDNFRLVNESNFQENRLDQSLIESIAKDTLVCTKRFRRC